MGEQPALAQLELLAEVDTLTGRLRRWADAAGDWPPAQTARALVARLIERTDSLRVRLQCPLVVATLGGTGTGKSALVNALAGAEVAIAGRSRPTTLQPTLVCRGDITPQMLGIDPAAVELHHHDHPRLADLVLIDCPDPDTTEDPSAEGTNLARLRPILAHCDVLLVASTQQKYRSARVNDELAAAAPGARLVFVQTHADTDEDIRADWRALLDPRYVTGPIFLVDSIAALADAQAGREPRGDFARLVDLLTRQLTGAMGNRIRRANYLDLVADTLARAAERLAPALPAVAAVEATIAAERTKLGARLARRTRDELLVHRRLWESRLVGKAAQRWGLSPFSLVLRVYQGLGGMLSNALLLRARTPAQVGLWGAMEAARRVRRAAGERQAETAVADTAACWPPAELAEAAIVLRGDAARAGLDRRSLADEQIQAEAAEAGGRFAAAVAVDIDALLEGLAARKTGLFTRLRYELLLLAMLGFLLYRLGKNFFYDSWWLDRPAAIHGSEFYLAAAFWIILWSAVLLWFFTGRLRRGLRYEIDRLAQGWGDARPAARLFTTLERQCAAVRDFGSELESLQAFVAELRRRLSLPEGDLGHRR